MSLSAASILHTKTKLVLVDGLLEVFLFLGRASRIGGGS